MCEAKLIMQNGRRKQSNYAGTIVQLLAYFTASNQL